METSTTSLRRPPPRPCASCAGTKAVSQSLHAVRCAQCMPARVRQQCMRADTSSGTLLSGHVAGDLCIWTPIDAEGTVFTGTRATGEVCVCVCVYVCVCVAPLCVRAREAAPCGCAGAREQGHGALRRRRPVLLGRLGQHAAHGHHRWRRVHRVGASVVGHSRVPRVTRVSARRRPLAASRAVSPSHPTAPRLR